MQGLFWTPKPFRKEVYTKENEFAPREQILSFYSKPFVVLFIYYLFIYIFILLSVCVFCFLKEAN